MKIKKILYILVITFITISISAVFYFKINTSENTINSIGNNPKDIKKKVYKHTFPERVSKNDSFK
jgi:hypothetical protein